MRIESFYTAATAAAAASAAVFVAAAFATPPAAEAQGFRVADINPGTVLSGDNLDSPPGALLGGQLYFGVRDNVEGQLWRSNGTAGATVPIAVPTPGSATDVDLATAAGPFVFFTYSDPAAGTELWRTDGTAAGTFRLADIRPGPQGSKIEEIVALGASACSPPATARRPRALALRRHAGRHGAGQGHRPRRARLRSARADRRGGHALLLRR